MKIILTLITLLTIASCTQKCEIEGTLGQSHCYSSDGWYGLSWVHPRTYEYTHVAYDADNFDFEEVCADQPLEEGSCDYLDY